MVWGASQRVHGVEFHRSQCVWPMELHHTSSGGVQALTPQSWFSCAMGTYTVLSFNVMAGWWLVFCHIHRHRKDNKCISISALIIFASHCKLWNTREIIPKDAWIKPKDVQTERSALSPNTAWLSKRQTSWESVGKLKPSARSVNTSSVLQNQTSRKQEVRHR